MVIFLALNYCRICKLVQELVDFAIMSGNSYVFKCFQELEATMYMHTSGFKDTYCDQSAFDVLGPHNNKITWADFDLERKE